jgi:hypothetical protein
MAEAAELTLKLLKLGQGGRAYLTHRLDLSVTLQRLQFVIHGDLAHLGFQMGDLVVRLSRSRSFTAVAASARARSRHSVSLAISRAKTVNDVERRRYIVCRNRRRPIRMPPTALRSSPHWRASLPRATNHRATGCAELIFCDLSHTLQGNSDYPMQQDKQGSHT